MEGFTLLLVVPLLGLGLLGCSRLWRLLNHGSTGERAAGRLLFIPSLLLTLFFLFMVISVFNPPKRIELDRQTGERR
jgi:hypothetical protein